MKKKSVCQPTHISVRKSYSGPQQHRCYEWQISLYTSGGFSEVRANINRLKLTEGRRQFSPVIMNETTETSKTFFTLKIYQEYDARQLVAGSSQARVISVSLNPDIYRRGQLQKC